MTQGIIVLGVQRSGTSLVTELIHRWGAYAGQPQDLLSADERNQRGYWEYVRVKEFNTRLLDSVGASVRVPPIDEQVLVERAQQDEYRAPALRLLAEMRIGNRVWVWKDPRFSMLLPFWRQIWGDVLYVVPVRYPADSAHSQQKITATQMPIDFPRAAFYLYWQRLMLSVLRGTVAVEHKLFLSYETLVQEPQQEVERLCQVLDAYCGRRDDPEPRIASMLDAIQPQLRHQRSSGDFNEEPLATSEQKALYRYLVARTADRHLPFRPEDFPIFPGWHEYLRNMDTLYQLYAQYRAQRRS